MAAGLDELVARFRLDQQPGAATANVVQKRRSADWGRPADSSARRRRAA
jgi:hypothetical protein